MSGRRVRGRAVAVLAVVALVVAGCGGDDGGGSAEAPDDAPRVALEPVGSAGQDPFTEAVGIDEVADFPEAVAATASDVVGEGVPDEGTGGVRLAGGTAGLYGGTEDQDSCDVEQLVGFLTDGANADKAAAFAGALGIEVGEIADHLATLTPVVLIADAVVTNHGFRDGRATPYTAVLQAGTAVLVDDLGVPRVKCACGNPLAEPPPRVELTRTQGNLWPGYEPGSTITVGPAGEPLGELTLTDTTTGDAYQREVGLAPAAPALDVRNTTLPPGACYDDEPPLTLVDGITQTEADPSVGQGVQGAEIKIEPITADIDGDGTPEVTFVLECFSCGASCAESSSILTVRGGEGGAEMVAVLREEAGVPTLVESLSLTDGLLAAQGRTFGPGDNNADGPTQQVSSQWRFQGGAWAAA